VAWSLWPRHAGEAEEMKAHLDRAIELAGTKNPAGQAEACCALAIETCKLWAITGDEALLQRAAQAARDTLDVTASMRGQLPWESVAHAVLAVVADAEDRPDEAEEEARTALSTLDGMTHILHYVNVLWAAGRVLIGRAAPEAAGMAQQVAQGLGYLSMSIVDPEIRSKWFAVEAHRELAQLAGFELPEYLGEAQEPADLDDHELALLREITSGTYETDHDKTEVDELLAKLGVASETEAIEYAIKAGVRWR
jgi:hypothetical protein